MSRRTKLSITAFFLVLLAIPAVYIALSWSPADPLRFQLVPNGEDGLQMSDIDSTGYIPLAAIVENTSATHVHLVKWLEMGSPHAVKRPIRRPGQLETVHLDLPPHSTAHIYFFVQVKDLYQAEGGELWICYWSVSGSKRKVQECLLWLSKRLPDSWRDHVPLLGADERVARLPIPAGTAASYGLKPAS